MAEVFTVEQRGIGRPDYTPAFITSKPVVVEGQDDWNVTITKDDLAPGTVYSEAAYTVPEGYRLNLGGLIITCSGSCIQKLILYTPGKILGDYLYDMRGDIVFGPLSSKTMLAGQVLTVYIYNNDSVARDFSLSILGVLERVGA
ncbi:hypothetical protein ES703_125433 [subsurface metagenome]